MSNQSNELDLLRKLEETTRVLNYARTSRKITIEERDVLEEKSLNQIKVILKELTTLRGEKYPLSTALDNLGLGHCFA